MIYTAYLISEDDRLAEDAFDIAWPYLIGTGHQDCISHQVAVTSYINAQLERGVRNKLVIANRAITLFEQAKAQYATMQAG